MKKFVTLTLVCATALSAGAQSLADAIKLTDKEQFEKATAAFKKIVATEPQNGEAWFYFGENFWENQRLGKALWSQGKKAEAQTMFDQAITDATDKANKFPKPLQATTYREIAEAVSQGAGMDLIKAQEFIAKSLELDPKNPETFVLKGDVLFEVDPEPLRAALAQASAAVDSARLSVLQARAAYGLAQAQQQAAEVEAAYQKDNLDRQLGLAAKGVATSTSVDDVRHTADKAAEQLAAARQSVAAALAALGDSVSGDVDAHPAAAAALAARDRAAYNLAAATVRAPADGVVYQSTGFRPGLYVSPGASLFTIVETGAPWIDANLKETELVDVRPGQTADIAFDVDPDVHLKATVESIGAGTGAEFSLLPAQNATGNWVKVTQRIPVRLKLETPGADVLLRSGMSAQVAIDTGRSRSIADLFGRAHAAE
jgi:membrane fusion protein (multidrug efflux system)